MSSADWRSRFPDGVAFYESLNPDPYFDRLFTATLEMWRNTGEGNYPVALVEQIDCPTLVIGGEADHLALIETSVKLAKQISGARLGILPFGDHILFQTHPERIAPYVKEFIAMTPSN